MRARSSGTSEYTHDYIRLCAPARSTDQRPPLVSYVSIASIRLGVATAISTAEGKEAADT